MSTLASDQNQQFCPLGLIKASVCKNSSAVGFTKLEAISEEEFARQTCRFVSFLGQVPRLAL